MTGSGKPAIRLLLIALCLATHPGCRSQAPQPTLGERLQGNWSCERSIREDAFLRSDRATLEILETSIKYSYDSRWECADSTAASGGIGSCAGTEPQGRNGYFEGVFLSEDDSLILRDAAETVSARNVRADGFDLIVGGLDYPMVRNPAP